jgi:hypothetical protein
MLSPWSNPTIIIFNLLNLIKTVGILSNETGRNSNSNVINQGMEQHVEQEQSLGRDVKEAITWRVRSGFYTSDEIVNSTADWASREGDLTIQEAKRRVRRAVAIEWTAQLEKQQAWPDEPTVSDKLGKAFTSLERNHKILARINQMCCNTCGREEVAEDRDEDTRGYVFFHEQETESVVNGGDLHLAFGSFTKSEKKNRIVGDIIVRSLRWAGLSVEWTGDLRRKILVRCREWRRRFDGDEEIEDVNDDDFDTDCVSSGHDSESDQEPDTHSDLGLSPD